MKIEITLDDKAIKAALARIGGPALNKILRPSLEKRANEARREAVKTFVSRGIGRGIFGRNAAGAWKMIKVSKVTESGGNLSLKMEATGLAGLQEMGGRIKPHVIKPKRGGVLAFQMAGELAFAKFVNHPGAQVKQVPALKPAAEKIPGQVIADVQPQIAALWGKAA